MRHSETQQDLANNPGRFDTYIEVLASEGFMGGRHYWEVEVRDEVHWDLAV